MGRSVFLPVLAGLVVFPGASAATPRLASIVGQNCNLCHHNPTGGGLRSLYASQYLVPTRLAARPLPEGAKAPVNPQIGDDVTVGADLRFFHLKEEDQVAGNNFLTMQASVYLAFQPDPRASLYIHQEFGQGSAQAYEVYAMGYVLPKTGYVKIGKFIPAFGWKVPDHRAFTRREYVFFPPFPPQADTGVEAGIYPGPVSLEASITNGEFRGSRDTNEELAFTARGSVRGASSRFGVNAVAGASYHQRGEKGDGVWSGGPFASATWNRITWLGEVDWTHTELPAQGVSARSSQTAVTLSQEASLRLMQGVDLVFAHDFFDPTKNEKTGSLQRWGAGMDVLGTHFLEISAMFYVFQPDDGPEIATRFGYPEDRWQSAVQVHVLY